MTTPPPDPAQVSAATAGDRECALQVMRAVHDLDAATRNLDIVEGLRLAHAAGDIIAAHVAAATAKERQARELAEGEIKDIAKDRLALFRATYAWVADIEAEAGGVGSGNIHGIYCKAKAAVMGSPLYEEMNIAREATNFDTP